MTRRTLSHLSGPGARSGPSTLHPSGIHQVLSLTQSPESPNTRSAEQPVRFPPAPGQGPAPAQTVDAVAEEPAKSKTVTSIYARLLIPGRGKPSSDQVVIIDGTTIAYVGSYDDIPAKYKDVAFTVVPVLMPGMWDCHTHFSGSGYSPADFVLPFAAECGARISRSFYDTLMAGFTSVREVGGYAIEASKAVEEGLILGPNVYGAGAAISQTAGHGDIFELPIGWVWRQAGTSMQSGGDYQGVCMLQIADGVEECRKAIRLQIRRGAKCIKILASGGVLSRDDDPLFQQFSDEELKTMVDEARRFKRVCAAHVHGKDGIMAAIRTGFHTIEHGSYLDDECIRLMKEKDMMLVATMKITETLRKNLDLLPEPQKKKLIQVHDDHTRSYKMAIKAGVKCALGTDLGVSDVSNPLAHGGNGEELAFAVECGMSPLEAIEAATANGPETLGPMAPKSGQIKVGYDADVIALSKNPLGDIKVVSDVENITHVWKGGKLSKSPPVPYGPVRPPHP